MVDLKKYHDYFEQSYHVMSLDKKICIVIKQKEKKYAYENKYFSFYILQKNHSSFL